MSVQRLPNAVIRVHVLPRHPTRHGAPLCTRAHAHARTRFDKAPERMWQTNASTKAFTNLEEVCTPGEGVGDASGEDGAEEEAA